MSSAHAVGSKHQGLCVFSESHVCLLCCKGTELFLGDRRNVAEIARWGAVVLGDLFVRVAVSFSPLDAPTVGPTLVPARISERLGEVSPIISKDPVPVAFPY